VTFTRTRRRIKTVTVSREASEIVDGELADWHAQTADAEAEE
jgi:hypothetical protein